jgi:hypothetical protein
MERGVCASRTGPPLLTTERPTDRFILMIDDLATVRTIHVLGVVHWIGGVAAVTTIVLPYARLLPDANAAIAAFEAFERRFARQARISVALTGVSGIYMLWRLAAWERFEARPARSRAAEGSGDRWAFGLRRAAGPAIPWSSGWRARTLGALTSAAFIPSALNAAVADPPDEHGQPHLGGASHSRRTAHARY